MGNRYEKAAGALGRRLKQAREEAGISQLVAGSRVGSQGSQVTRWEQAAKPPSFFKLLDLAQLYSRPLSWFVQDIDAETWQAAQTHVDPLLAEAVSDLTPEQQRELARLSWSLRRFAAVLGPSVAENQD